jgi:HEAT repeat protein
MNFTKFEELNGIKLGMFISDAIKRADVDDEILTYYDQRKANLDSPHLEMVILLLEKLGTPAALNVIASLLDHPAKSVRYQAAQVITSAASLDEIAMTKVTSVLSHPPYPNDIIPIEDALYHGGTDTARTIAERFMEARKSERHQQEKR